MSTREENLKKLNEELEAMSDEELEEVAGGARNLIEKLKQINVEPYMDPPDTIMDMRRNWQGPYTDQEIQRMIKKSKHPYEVEPFK